VKLPSAVLTIGPEKPRLLAPVLMVTAGRREAAVDGDAAPGVQQSAVEHEVRRAVPAAPIELAEPPLAKEDTCSVPPPVMIVAPV